MRCVCFYLLAMWHKCICFKWSLTVIGSAAMQVELLQALASLVIYLDDVDAACLQLCSQVPATGKLLVPMLPPVEIHTFVS